MKPSRREFLKIASVLSVGTLLANYFPKTAAAKETTAPAVGTTTSFKGLRLKFFGDTTNEGVTEAISRHVMQHPKRMMMALGDTPFSRRMLELNKQRSSLTYISAVPLDDDSIDVRTNLIANWRADPDELIFQNKNFRRIPGQEHTYAKDQLHSAWMTGHHVTCGIIASDENDLHKQIGEILNLSAYGFDNRDIDKVEVFFSEVETSEHFRTSFRSDPTSNIYFG